MNQLDYSVGINNELTKGDGRQGGPVGYMKAATKANVNGYAHPFKSKRARNQTAEDRHQDGEGIISRNVRPFSTKELEKQNEFVKNNGRQGSDSSKLTNVLIGSAIAGHTAGALYNHYRDKKQEKASNGKSSRQGALGDAKDQVMAAQYQAQQQVNAQQAQQAQVSNIRAEQVAQDAPIMDQQNQQINVLTQSLQDAQAQNMQLQGAVQEASVVAQDAQAQADQAANVINTASVLTQMQAQNPDSPVILAAANDASSEDQ